MTHSNPNPLPESVRKRISTLRRALWDVGVLCGGDPDGDEGPEAMDDISLMQWAGEEAKALREGYDEMIRPAPQTTWTVTPGEASAGDKTGGAGEKVK